MYSREFHRDVGWMQQRKQCSGAKPDTDAGCTGTLGKCDDSFKRFRARVGSVWEPRDGGGRDDGDMDKYGQHPPHLDVEQWCLELGHDRTREQLQYGFVDEGHVPVSLHDPSGNDGHDYRAVIGRRRSRVLETERAL
jgi:hypothetical protein